MLFLVLMMPKIGDDKVEGEEEEKEEEEEEEKEEEEGEREEEASSRVGRLVVVELGDTQIDRQTDRAIEWLVSRSYYS